MFFLTILSILYFQDLKVVETATIDTDLTSSSIGSSYGTAYYQDGFMFFEGDDFEQRSLYMLESPESDPVKVYSSERFDVRVGPNKWVLFDDGVHVWNSETRAIEKVASGSWWHYDDFVVLTDWETTMSVLLPDNSLVTEAMASFPSQRGGKEAFYFKGHFYVLEFEQRDEGPEFGTLHRLEDGTWTDVTPAQFPPFHVRVFHDDERLWYMSGNSDDSYYTEGDGSFVRRSQVFSYIPSVRYGHVFPIRWNNGWVNASSQDGLLFAAGDEVHVLDEAFRGGYHGLVNDHLIFSNSEGLYSLSPDLEWKRITDLTNQDFDLVQSFYPNWDGTKFHIWTTKGLYVIDGTTEGSYKFQDDPFGEDSTVNGWINEFRGTLYTDVSESGLNGELNRIDENGQIHFVFRSNWQADLSLSDPIMLGNQLVYLGKNDGMVYLNVSQKDGATFKPLQKFPLGERYPTLYKVGSRIILIGTTIYGYDPVSQSLSSLPGLSTGRFFVLEDVAYFLVNSESGNGEDIWSTDATVEGTKKLSENGDFTFAFDDGKASLWLTERSDASRYQQVTQEAVIAHDFSGNDVEGILFYQDLPLLVITTSDETMLINIEAGELFSRIDERASFTFDLSEWAVYDIDGNPYLKTRYAIWDLGSERGQRLFDNGRFLRFHSKNDHERFYFQSNGSTYRLDRHGVSDLGFALDSTLTDTLTATTTYGYDFLASQDLGIREIHSLNSAGEHQQLAGDHNIQDFQTHKGSLIGFVPTDTGFEIKTWDGSSELKDLYTSSFRSPTETILKLDGDTYFYGFSDDGQQLKFLKVTDEHAVRITEDAFWNLQGLVVLKAKALRGATYKWTVEGSEITGSADQSWVAIQRTDSPITVQLEMTFAHGSIGRGEYVVMPAY